MKKLVVLLGSTGVGKTELSIKVAEHFSTPILSVDSRQLYRGIEIGTAAPTEVQRSRIVHHFVGVLELSEYYSASDYEVSAITKLDTLFETHDIVVATGGSMMYIDALCNGVDSMPTIDVELRSQLQERYEQEGLEPIQAQLKMLDPIHYAEVDLKNHKRVIHALEVCLMTGKPYSSFRTHTKKDRPFQIIKIGLTRDRENLYQRINDRVDQMINSGMLDEAKLFFDLRTLNSLNTVGYKELFKYLEGEWTLDFAIEKIKQNTRIYSRQQFRWFMKDQETHWINLSEVDESLAFNTIVDLVNV